MILNEEEKAQLLKALKNQYRIFKEMIEQNYFPWYVQDEEDKEQFVRDSEELKEYIEILESNEPCEVTFDFLKSSTWGALITEATLFGLGNIPEDNTDFDNSKLN